MGTSSFSSTAGFVQKNRSEAFDRKASVTFNRPMRLQRSCMLRAGTDGGLIWNIQEDMAHFKDITTKVTTKHHPDNEQYRMNAVIIGRITWESIPAKFRPLKNRINIVVSRSLQNHNDEEAADGQREEEEGGGGGGGKSLNRNVIFTGSLEGAVAILKGGLAQEVADCFSGTAYVIGGAALYEEAMQHKLCDTMHVTRVFFHGEFDRVFPAIDEREGSLYVRDGATETMQSKVEATSFRFETYTRRNKHL